MTVPTTHELAELARIVRERDKEQAEAFNFKDDSAEKYLEYQIALKRWAMAHGHLGERIREYIESGQSGVVRP